MAMSSDRSRERRQLAAECFGLAQQIADPHLRASLVAMAQTWLDLAERGPQKHDEATLRAIRVNIGKELRAQYEPATRTTAPDSYASDPA
jgi:hypothetical protein